MKAFALLSVLIGTWSLYGRSPGISIEPPRFRLGDDLRWKDPAVDDRTWSTVPPGGSPKDSGWWWARIHLSLSAAQAPSEPLAVEIQTLGSYVVYWDGIPIGTNGSPGPDKGAEVPGRHYRVVAIPAGMATPGSHVISLRISTWRSAIPSRYFRLHVASLGEIAGGRHWASVFYGAVFGLLLIAGIIFGFTRPREEPATAQFGWLCLAVALLLALEYGKFLIHYPYQYHRYRLVAITVLTQTVSVLLPWFLMARFGLSHRGYLAAAVVPVLWFPFLWWNPDVHCFYIFQFGLGYSLALCLRAAWLGRTGWKSVTLLVGLVLALSVVTGERFADRWFFPTFLLLVGLLAARVLLESRARSEALIQARLTSARLKLELLRKSIQPHFLKNSLAAAMGWIEENPDKGIGLLASLAAELDCFFKIGDRDLVDLEEELNLCRTHLETMAYVMDNKLRFRFEGETRGLKVPPGLLITCVENALTHGRFDSGGGEVSVRLEWADKGFRLVIRNPAEPAGSEREGTGTRYLRELLARHYPERWSLYHEYQAGCRISTIAVDWPPSHQGIPN